jgi:Na+-translocating ferredoxin:NAD+ oxidoreductase RnfG subunit
LEWASPSRRGGLLLLALASVLGGSLAAPAEAKVFLSRKEALAWAFPDAEVGERITVLTSEQASAVETLARAPLESKIVKLYTAREDDAVVGYAFIDIHTVRTQPEAFLVVLTPEGSVRSLRVLAFYEPEEYLPPGRWLEQFDAARLGRDLRVGGAIHGIAGATLSARAVSAGVRRSLALWQVLVGRADAPATEREDDD